MYLMVRKETFGYAPTAYCLYYVDLFSLSWAALTFYPPRIYK